MIFDLDMEKCIACGACAVACMDQNDVDLEQGDVPFRYVSALEEPAGAGVAYSFLSLSCMHCENAPCVAGCPTGSIFKDARTGLTLYDTANCIGCHSCAMACPFGAPAFSARGKLTKCDGCVQRVRAGLEPACVRVCPFGALKVYADKEEYMAAKRSHGSKVVGEALEDRFASSH